MRRMGRIWTWREEAAGAFWDEARAVLKGNGIIAVPTETFYALAVNPFQEEALVRLFALKDRAPEKPVLVLVDGPDMLPQVVREVPDWPGAYGKVLARPPDHHFAEPAPSAPAAHRGHRDHRGAPAPPGAHLPPDRRLGFPITGTSANRSGRPPLVRADEVAREFGDHLDLILEAGACPGGLPSTIVDVTGSPPRLVRAGAVPPAELAEIVPEMGRIASNGGRQVKEPAVVGIDLGGTNVRLALVSPQGKILSRWERATATMPDQAALVATLAATWPWPAKPPGLRAGKSRRGHRGARAGFCPRKAGWSFPPTCPALNDCPLVDRLSPQVNWPLFLENDANLFALGEHWLGAGVGHHQMLGITLGTGVGGGLILNGRLWAGTEGTSRGNRPHDRGPGGQEMPLRQPGLPGDPGFGLLDRGLGQGATGPGGVFLAAGTL